MKNTLLVSLILVFLNQYCFAILEDPQVVSFHKLYLHTDREYYFVGDTLRFSGYLLNAQTHAPLNNSCNLHVEIASATGSSVQKDLFLIQNGLCKGQLILDKSIQKKGNYIFRAYTDDLRTEDKHSIYSKAITISPLTKTFITTPLKQMVSTLTIDLFPEGGFLLADRYNQMAFKVTDQAGKPVNVSGKLINEKNETITPFTCSFNGMGIIHFTPNKESKYFLEINGIKKHDYNFPEIRSSGSKLMLTRLNANGVDINIVADSISAKNKFYIVSMHRGQRSTFAEIGKNQSDRTIHIKNELLKHGINRIILLNQDFIPISERLIFVDKIEENQLKLNINQKQFAPREEVLINISGTNNKETVSDLYLSVTVVDSKSIPGSGIPQNIKSYLLIDTELRGYIHNPASYFINEPNSSSAQKLNLLMMTQGWSNYIWNSLPRADKIEEDLNPVGLKLSGSVKNNFSNKPLPNCEVSLSFNSKGKTFMDFTKSDSFGRYEFDNLILFDSATVIIQGKNKKRLNTTISLDSILFDSPSISESEIKMSKHFSDIPLTLYSQAIKNEIRINEFFPDRNSRLLEEIEVKASKPKQEYTNMGHYRPYTTPTVTVEVEEKFQAIPNVVEFLEGRVAGFSGLLGKNSRKERALFLIDGIETPIGAKPIEHIKTISMTDIERVEILKYAAATIYGSRGAGGVVNIILKDGSSYKPTFRSLRGTIAEKIKGFSSYREFYSPRYNVKNIDTEIPDYRTTLYWNPLILSDTTTTDLSFFTCDNTGRYKVFVEGISKEGRICLGEAELELRGPDKPSGPKISLNK